MIADTVITNGKVYSVDLDGARTGGTAVAIADGKILAVGTDDEIIAYAGDNTERIDAGGNSILPGLCDDHCHASFSSSFSVACNLFDIPTTEEMSREDLMDIIREKLSVYIKEHPDNKIIRGCGWNLGAFNGYGWKLPCRQDLDVLDTDKPIALESYCQHNLWVNTAALDVALIDADTVTPENGTIQREEDGYPTGLFQEMSAMSVLKDGISFYDYSVEQYKDTIRYYQEELANLYGVTLVNDVMFTDNAKEAYRQLAADEELTIRVRGVYDVYKDDVETKMPKIIAEKGIDDINDLFSIPTIKFFMEGEFSMLEPYEPEIIEQNGLPEGYRSHAFWEEDDAAHYFYEFLKAGYQIHTHAMGDQSIRNTVNAFEKAQKAYGKSGRNIIAHLMAVPDQDIKKIGELNLVCSCQPRWMIYDIDVEEYYIPYFGEERALNFYPNKRLRDAGAVVAYGTDFPVVPPPNPFHEIQCGMTRRLFPGAPGYETFGNIPQAPKDKPDIDIVTLDESIQSLTINGAYQNYLEDLTGSIEAGKSAELVILDCDIENIPVDEIYDIKVLKTIFKGKTVYEKEA